MKFLDSRPLLVAFLAVVLSGSLAAQTPILGPQSGTLPAGVYVATGQLSVAAATTWTLSAGVIIKVSGLYALTVNGTLLANGVAGNPVIFTDDADDTAGGDTNGGGPSTGVPAAWRGILFLAGSGSSSLAFTEVRYGGANSYANIGVNGVNPTISNCTMRNCFGDGMVLVGAAAPTVTSCAFVNNAAEAVDGVPLSSVAGFSNNTASGNGGNYMRVTSGAVSSNLTITPSSVLSGALMIDTQVVVASGVTLTLNAGVVLKLMNLYSVDVNGTLVANGTLGNPVIFTDDADDTAGGDTNGGGPSAGVPAAWRGILFLAGSGSSSIAFTEVRYGGANSYANIGVNGVNPTISNCTMRNCFGDGMVLVGAAAPTVTSCAFVNNAAEAVDGVPLSSVAGFSNNTASGNGGNYMRVTSGAVSSNLTITPSSILSGALMVETPISVASGATLTLSAGTVLKFMSLYTVDVNGVLVANGTAGNPVVFTDDADDTAGGDTNGGGPSVGAPASWRGIQFLAGSGASNLNFTEVRYGGANSVSNVEIAGVSPTLSNCTIRNCYGDGMALTGAATPTVTNCAFLNNVSEAVDGVALSAVPGFSNNTASGNGGDFMRVTGGAVTGPVAISADSVLGGALVVSTQVTVQLGGVLTVNRGVIFKFPGLFSVTIDGIAHLRGTAYEPIVFTDDADDEFGGDTNGDGPSTGVFASWRGVIFNSGAASSAVENVVIRYTGANSYPGLTVSSPNVTLRSTRVDKGWSGGIVLNALAGDAVNLVAWGCSGSGIVVHAGNFAVVHATSVMNGTGIHNGGSFVGMVINSNSWLNIGGPNFSNFGAAQVSYSNGFSPGGTGNISVDPQFVSATTGDLHLASTSPIVGIAEPLAAFAVLKDHDEYPRLLDSNLTGTISADMGAFECSAWDMDVSGVPRIGTNLVFSVSGPPGDTLYVLGILDGVFPVNPFGIVLAGAIPYVTVVPLIPTTLPVGTFLTIPIPNDPGLVNLEAGIQTLTTVSGNPAIGNLTQLYRARIRP